MTKDIREIKKSVSRTIEDEKNELLYYHYANDPSLPAKLYRVIYDDFMNCHIGNVSYAEATYKSLYDKWVKECEVRGWQFPEQLMGVDTLDKFKDKFLFK